MASYDRASDCKAIQVKARPQGGNRKGNTLLLRRVLVATLLCFALGIRKTVGNGEDVVKMLVIMRLMMVLMMVTTMTAAMMVLLIKRLTE